MMTADTITLDALDDLADMLLTARDTVRRVRLQAESGDCDTDEAAEIIRYQLQALTAFYKP